MTDPAIEVIRNLRTEQQLGQFASRLRAWLVADQEASDPGARQFPESRAQALLRASGALDEATIGDFRRLVASSAAERVVLYDLLDETELAQQDEVRALAAVTGGSDGDDAVEVPWLSLALAGFAWQRGYPLTQLDPSSPPQRYSPAGQVVTKTASFLRRQIQRTALERGRLERSLAPRDATTASLDELHPEGTIPPLPPHFRSPIPVRYPEISRETLHVEPLEDADARSLSRGDPVVITDDDLGGEAPREAEEAAEAANPIRMPPIRIEADQVREAQLPSPLPPNAVVMPAASADARPGLTVALRQMFSSEELASTKLRVVTQEYPDGPGLFGLQVKISCKGIKSFVAGTTDREGRFLAELPVKRTEGLTYDVDVTWPREMGGETERKSMTLHADRTEFLLPFYHRLDPHRPEED